MSDVIPSSFPTGKSLVPGRFFRRAKHAIFFAARALRESVNLARSEKNPEGLQIARNVFTYRVKQFLLKISPRWEFRSERLFRWRIEHFDFLDFLDTFEIIFLRKEYRFESASRRPVILDCGSNLGLSIFYFKKEYPECSITAFEPDPEAFELLRKNVSRNRLSGIELRNQAVCGTSGPVKLYCDRKHAGNVAMSTRPQCGLTDVREVGGVRLTEVISTGVDLLKLDVEGAELEVIEDLAERGKIRLIQEMLIEYHPALFPNRDGLTTLCSLLERSGFQWEIRSGHPPAAATDIAPVTLHARQAASRNGPRSDYKPTCESETVRGVIGFRG